MATVNLTGARLRQLLQYNPATGFFFWLVRPCPSVHIGDQAGTRSKAHGYIRIQVMGRIYGAHRLAWLHVHDAWPSSEIDHINGDRADNRLENLRNVSKAGNMQNKKRSASATGLIGVSFRICRGKFQASIGVGGRQFHLGHFDTAAEARAAYLAAKSRLHLLA